MGVLGECKEGRGALCGAERKADVVMSSMMMHGKLSTPSITLQGTVEGVARFLASIGLASAIVVLQAILFTPPLESGIAPIDPATCGTAYPENCACWDGKAKGPYAKGGYKSVFMNYDSSTAWLILWTQLFSSMLIKFIERCLALLFCRQLRYRSLATCCLCATSIFYGWGCVFNYINDRAYSMLRSQMFFTLTELVPALCLAILCDARMCAPPALLYASIYISLSHIALALAEQGFAHLFLKSSRDNTPTFLQARDLLFLVCDTLTAGFVVVELRKQHAPTFRMLLVGAMATCIAMKLALISM
jgi:hypothetical protein